MLKKKGVVAFDFDGVIGDSVKECFVQATRAFAEMGSKVKRNRQTERLFREGRPLITKVEHLFTITKMIQENPKVDFGRMTQAQFNATHTQNTQKAAEFAKRFYKQREMMKTSAPKRWIALQGAFPKIAKFISKIQRKNDVFIATTKDKKSTMELLASYGIKIPESHILSRDFSKDKKVQIQEIAKRAGVTPKEIVLVEDAVKQLRDVRTLGTRGVLVHWGYSTRAQRRSAKREGIPVIKKANVFGRIKIQREQRRARK